MSNEAAQEAPTAVSEEAVSESERPSKKPRLLTNERNLPLTVNPVWLNCTVCFEAPSSTPVQCRNGHILCRFCSQHISSCPTCRIEMNTENPILCRVATYALEESSKLCRCPGMGCTWTGPSDKYDSHEQQCLPAARATIAQLVQQQKALAAQSMNLSEKIDEMKENQKNLEKLLEQKQSNEDNAPPMPQPKYWPASLMAAWIACVEQYKHEKRKIENAEIKVMLDPFADGCPQMAKFAPYWGELTNTLSDKSEKYSWIHLHCKVPGTSFLKGTNLYLDTFYHPIYQRIFKIFELTKNGDIMRSIQLEDPNEWLTLQKLLETMQRAALLPVCQEQPESLILSPEAVVDQQKLKLCKAMDSEGSIFHAYHPPNNKNTESLDESTKRLTFVASDVHCAKKKIKGGVCPEPNALEDSKFKPSKTINLSNVSYRTKAMDIQNWLNAGGFYPTTVLKPDFVMRGRSRSYKVDTATVFMGTHEEAYKMLQKMNNKLLSGRQISMSL